MNTQTNSVPAAVVVRHQRTLFRLLTQIDKKKVTALLGSATAVGADGSLKWNWRDDNGASVCIELASDEKGRPIP